MEVASIQPIRCSLCDAALYSRVQPSEGVIEQLLGESSMEADTSDRDGDGDLVEQAYQYITAGTYPVGCPENRKRIIRKKSKKFQVRDGELLYVVKRKGKVSLLMKV